MTQLRFAESRAPPLYGWQRGAAVSRVLNSKLLTHNFSVFNQSDETTITRTRACLERCTRFCLRYATTFVCENCCHFYLVFHLKQRRSRLAWDSRCAYCDRPAPYRCHKSECCNCTRNMIPLVDNIARDVDLLHAYSSTRHGTGAFTLFDVHTGSDVSKPCRVVL